VAYVENLPDNMDNIIVPAESKLTQLGLEQFPEYDQGCTIFMKWWTSGITAPAPYSTDVYA
jgi:hypothetical protein